MSLSVHVTAYDGVVVVALDGTADAAMLRSLQAALIEALADARVLVLDLDKGAEVDVAAFCTMVGNLLADARSGQLRIAAREPTVRGALAKAGMHQLVSVYPSVADAANVDAGLKEN